MKTTTETNGQQEEWCVRFKLQKKRWLERRYYRQEWAARRYADRLLEHAEKYQWILIEQRPVGDWHTTDRIHIAPIDWDAFWSIPKRKWS